MERIASEPCGVLIILRQHESAREIVQSVRAIGHGAEAARRAAPSRRWRRATDLRHRRARSCRTSASPACGCCLRRNRCSASRLSGWNRGYVRLRPPATGRMTRSGPGAACACLPRHVGEARTWSARPIDVPRVVEGDLQARDLRFAILASRFNDFVVDRLVHGALDQLRRQGGDRRAVDLVRVPGA